MVSIMWFRRDLRLHDNPALLAAARDGEVCPLFVLDDRLWRPAGDPRRDYLRRSLAALDDSMGENLCVRAGDPVEVVPLIARELNAEQVHVAADFGPYGRGRDAAVAAALDQLGVELVATGSPYAAPPGTVLNRSSQPYSVFTPYRRTWREQVTEPPYPTPDWVRWVRVGRTDLPAVEVAPGLTLPEAGEAAARRRWEAFCRAQTYGLTDYHVGRDRPGNDGSSRLSHHLKWGEIHPRTLLSRDGEPLSGDGEPPSEGRERFEDQIAWRDFFADVLWRRPDSARVWYRPQYARLPLDSSATPDGAALLADWQRGRTGYPFVDAGMRQLLAEGWMHNRLRMVTASYLVKDLHLDWRVGARWFMANLVDGDLASNQHGWQWVAGSGTDAAPFHRVLNPVRQGLRFDPDGDYVRRYIPELRHLDGAAAHEPWRATAGYAHGYPRRQVEHSEERAEALRRHDVVRAASSPGSGSARQP